MKRPLFITFEGIDYQLNQLTSLIRNDEKYSSLFQTQSNFLKT